MRPFLLTLLLLFAPLARAGIVETLEPGKTLPSPSRMGLLLDAGAPSGASLGLVFRPVPAFRVWGGPAWNYVGWGVQGGVAVVPVRWAISPALSLEAGRYFDADVTRFVNDGSGAPSEVEPLLRRVGFYYVSALVGLELGSQHGFAFSLRAGLSRVVVAARGSTSESAAGGTSDVTFSDPKVTAVMPAVKLGFQYFF